jgi:purine-cytosine permease-like protein
MSWMLKNSKGKPDAMLTFAAISFLVSSFAVLMGVIKVITVGTVHLEFGNADASLVLGYLGACFTSYVMRRNTKDKLDFEEVKHLSKKE